MRDLVSRFLAGGPPRRVAVLGDLLVDESYEAEVTRVAPEAPVPVMRITHAPPARMPGGAGNVARQFGGLRALGFAATLVAPCDHLSLHSGDLLHPPLPLDFFDRCVPLGDRARVPIKRRWYQGDRLLFRNDVQDDDYGCSYSELLEVREKMMAQVTSLLEQGVDAMILSDYAGGAMDADLIAWVVGRCRWRKVPVFVDPKRRPFAEWRGCTALKLNRSELAGNLAAQVGRICDAECVVVTSASQNPVVATRGGVKVPDPVPLRQPRERCVSGAGDCFLAYFVSARLRGFSYEDAAALAHAAGRVYVGGFYNTPVEPEDLRRAADPVMGKVVRAGFVREAVPDCDRLVFTNGCFDVALTTGHLKTLQWARDQGGFLVVGLNSDASVARLKGDGRPANPAAERAFRLACLDCVDLIVVFDEDTPEALMREIRPNVLVKGPEYRGRKVPGDDLCETKFAPDSGSGVHSTHLLA